MIYCIDSHTFIWAVKKQADVHDQHMIEEARILMEWIDQSNHQIMVPTIVLAECLIREPEINHAPIIEAANRHFIVADFDSRCSLKYGQLLRLDKWQTAKAVSKTNDIRREKMKLDHMIIATALVHGADGVFSCDEGIKVFANNIISVYPPSIVSKEGIMLG